MKTLYLHIGTTKTGTSSIQQFLWQNAAVLEKYGYCFPKALRKYPHVCSNRNAHFLAANFFLEDGSHDRALEEQEMQAGMERIVNCFLQFDNVVLSDEALWRTAGRSRKEIFPFLSEHAAQHGYTIKIIVYLRRQDAYLISNWNQTIKHCTSEHRALSFDERLPEILKNERFVVSYAKRLDALAALFGSENLIVRRYQPDSWYHGLVIDDFMQALGLEVTDEYQPLEDQINPGLLGNTTEIQRLINKNDSFSTEECIYLGKFLRELSPEAGSRYPCSMLSPEETKKLLKKFEKGNAHVASEYIGDGNPLFSDRISDLPKWQPDNPYMTEDVIRFFSAVSIDLRRENEALHREIDELREMIKAERASLRTLKDKLHHPLRTLFHMIFRRKK